MSLRGSDRARRERAPRVGLVSVGLAAYWPQFPGLFEELKGYGAEVANHLRALGAEVVDAGWACTPEEAATAAETVRGARLDLLVIDLATYATSSQVVPIAAAAGVPTLVIDLQPNPAMDHANT